MLFGGSVPDPPKTRQSPYTQLADGAPQSSTRGPNLLTRNELRTASAVKTPGGSAVPPSTLIVTHETSDFDALAATVAARGLYPEATIGLGRRLARPVRDFVALHKDRLDLKRVDQIDLATIRRLVVVDVRSRRRLKHVQPVLDAIDAGRAEAAVYDHHPASDDDLLGSVHQVEAVGAVTTLLAEHWQARGLEPAPLEATLFALGIYTDTAALTLGHTSPRDAAAVSWLLTCGANLAVLNRYLYPPLSDAQRRALGELLESTQVESVGGLDIGFATLRMPRHLDGMAEVTTEACKLDNLAALFAVLEIKQRKQIQVIARSRSPLIDVARAVRQVGGGGHRGAAAATVKAASAEAVSEALKRALHESPPRPKRLSDLMTSPVRTVKPSDALQQVGRHLKSWRCSGVPVVRDGRLVGVISRRDVDRAAAAGRSHLPASSHMTSEVKTASPDTALETALSLMTSADIGRLPVVRDDELVGIVSRTDVLAALYPDRRE